MESHDSADVSSSEALNLPLCFCGNISLLFHFLRDRRCTSNAAQSRLFPPSFKLALVPVFISLHLKRACLKNTHLYCHFYSAMTKTSHFCLPLKKRKSPIMPPPSRRLSSLTYHFSHFLHSNGKLLAVVLDQCVEIR